MQAIDKAVQNKIDQWLNGNFDEESKKYIQNSLDEERFDELTDAFYKDLEFGTGGLRGIMGVGSNRVNKYTFGMATQGFSNYLIKKYGDEQIRVVIAHDNRNNSETLAKIVADVFSANNIFVYFFEGLRPTPELSFAIRELKCHGGVMLTASHNPKEYNGYKAYGPDGGQFVSPFDKRVMEEVKKIESIDDVLWNRLDENIEIIGKEIDQKYIETIAGFSMSPEAIKRQKDLKIVFSPIHGTAGVLMPDVFKRFGFENVTLVESQMNTNGDFPTVIYPNPEEKEALTLALEKAREADAELVMATDPDADRVGIAVKNNKGDFVLLNGNQTGALLINYILTVWEKAGKLTGNEFIVSTIVTTNLINEIAASKGVDCYDTLTGFKYIGNLMTQLKGKKQFIAGGEESYGYLIGDHVRDKDAIVSAAFIAEMAAYYKDRGISLFEALLEMYRQYGIYREKLVSLTKKGKAGAEEIQQMMKNFRQNPPHSLGGSKVVRIKDYLTSEDKNIVTGDVKVLDYPPSNVLQFIMEDGSIASARPSGTEPKIKFYCSVKSKLMDNEDYEPVCTTLEKKLDMIIEGLQS